MLINEIIVGDCRETLKKLSDGSVHCVVTSPPYWGLRSYKGDPGMIGLEPTFDEHLANLIQVFDEVWRVLRDDGTLWLNYGDAYATGSYRSVNNEQIKLDDESGDTDNVHSAFRDARYLGQNKKVGFVGSKPKDLMMMPARVAIALQESGWYLRSEIIWAKPNPMPESCTDRPTNAHEKIFLLSKKKKYFYDSHAVKTKQKYIDKRMDSGGMVRSTTQPDSPYESCKKQDGGGVPVDGLSNLRNVWKIPTHPFKGSHFATFPLKLIEPCIKAGTSEKGCCSECGAPWTRMVSSNRSGEYFKETGNVDRNDSEKSRVGDVVTETIGWIVSCDCDAEIIPCTVLDPFGGAGTVSVMSEKLDRSSVICEISQEYADIAIERIKQEQLPLLAAKIITG